MWAAWVMIQEARRHVKAVKLTQPCEEHLRCRGGRVLQSVGLDEQLQEDALDKMRVELQKGNVQCRSQQHGHCRVVMEGKPDTDCATAASSMSLTHQLWLLVALEAYVARPAVIPPHLDAGMADLL